MHRFGLTVLVWMAGCGTPPVDVDLSQPMPDSLASLHLFTVEDGSFSYNERVVPYDLNTPLFSDYALKDARSTSPRA